MTFTRKKSEIANVGSKIDRSRNLYQGAWARASRLNPDGTWMEQYRELQNSDIRGPLPGDDATDLAAVRTPRIRDRGMARQEMSWIWLSVRADDGCGDQVSHNALLQ
jgi:hypothetical protein